jgi:thiol-disulfide isomerase/thioredoxin
MNRRALFAASGLAAAAAGASLSWWHTRPIPQSLDAPTSPDLWSLRFARPEGGELVMAQLRGRPLVLNFWATWCPPCIREMPQLSRFAREFRPAGWQVVGLAAESAEPVRRFLQKLPVDFPVGLAGVQALGLAARGGAQVSTNLIDIDATPLAAVVDEIERLAAACGVAVKSSELVGLMPARVAAAAAGTTLRLSGFGADRLLEVASGGEFGQE